MIGKTISHYRILTKLGGGGMGVVYKGLDTLLDRAVALKVLSPRLLHDPTAVTAFLREAKAASSLNHPNILTVYDLLQAEGEQFLVMEHVDGKTLRALLGKKGMEFRELLNIATEVAEALAAAHKAGIVHRDLKPENIMVRADGHVKVVDFGLAKLFGAQKRPASEREAAESTASLTSPLALPPESPTEQSFVAGTLPYMSPEQLTGKHVDHRSDIFSFGIVLYEMATGRQPYQGRTTAEIFESILTKAPPPVTDLTPVAPERLQEVISKALEKDPADRYQHIEDIAVDLRRLKRVTDSAEKVWLAARREAWSPRKIRIGLRGYLLGGAALAVGALILIGLLTFSLRRPAPLKIVHAPQKITHTGGLKLGALVTDGAWLYFSERIGSRYGIEQVFIDGGEPVSIPTSLAQPQILDISPDGSQLVVLNLGGGQAEAGVYTLPLSGGSPGRLGDMLVGAAAFSASGEMVYAREKDLYVRRPGRGSSKLLTAPGMVNGIRWSPDGSLLRLTLYDQQKNSSSLLEVSADGTNPHPLLPPGWNDRPDECCGNWTADGKYFVFQSSRGGSTSIWATREKANLFQKTDREPFQLTLVPTSFRAPVPSKDGKKLFAIGDVKQGELVGYDSKSHQFAPYLSGLSGDNLDFSADGKWVAYVTYSDSSLWRSRADGSDRLQLTLPPLRVLLPRWSPDSKRIAFAAQQPDAPWKIYAVSADGGSPEQMIPNDPSAEYGADWSEDGKMLAFGPPPFVAAGEGAANVGIQLFDLGARHLSKLPGSEGLICPRWSPGGKYFAAVAPSEGKVALYDFSLHKWTAIVPGKAGQEVMSCPAWSRDAEWMYFVGLLEQYGVFRVHIGDHRIEQVASLEGVRLAGGPFGPWFGLASNDSPLVLRDTSVQEIYAFDLEGR